MTHDIAHCDGLDCPRKDSCRRYLAHIEAVRLHICNIAYILAEQPCNEYWEDAE